MSSQSSLKLNLKEHDYAGHVHSEDITPLPTPLPTTTADTDTDCTNSSSEFDWDDDDGDQVDRSSAPSTKAKRGRAIYLAFMRLSRLLRVMLLGIIGVGILITPLLVVHLTRFKNSPARLQIHVWSLWLSIIWLAGCITTLVVDAIPRLVVGVVVLFGSGKAAIERLKVQLEVTLAVSFYLKLALDISWAWIALSILRSVYKPSNSYWSTVNRVMQVLFSAGILVMVEKIILRAVAVGFHRKALADRLSENKECLKVLERLSIAQPRAKPKSRGTTQNPSVDLNKHGHKKGMTSIIVDQVQGLAFKDTNRKKNGNLASARRLARKLFGALGEERHFLVVEDFYPYFPTTSAAHAAFHLFDTNTNGDISRREMHEAVTRIYRERRDLVISLKDAGSAVNKLDMVLLGVGVIIWIFVCLLVFNSGDTLTSLVPLATIVLGFSFIFGNSAATLFGSLVFIFATHVWDVGDLVLIDDQYLFVKEFGLFSTVFRRVDGQEIIAPNSLLSASKLIHNIRRSGSMAETTNLMVSYSTPLALIEELRKRVVGYAADNSREWASAGVSIDKMEYMNCIWLVVAVEHRSNWQDWGARWARRNAFMKYLKGVLEELGVTYVMPTVPVVKGGKV